MIVEIQNLTARKISKNFISKIIHTVLEFEGKSENGSMSVGVAVVGRVRMRNLNRRYNGRNRATDVLSFSGSKDFRVQKEGGGYLGEVIMCPGGIFEHALRDKVSF